MPSQFRLNDPNNNRPTYDYDLLNQDPSLFIYDATRLQFTSQGVSLLDPTDQTIPTLRPITSKYFTILNTFTATVNTSTSATTITPEISGECIKVDPGFGEQFIRFQHTNDGGANWYFYNTLENRWMLSTDSCFVSGNLLESNTADELTPQIMQTFHISDPDNFQAGDGTSMYNWRVIFYGDPLGNITTSLSDVQVGVTQYYTNATQVRSKLKAYNIVRTNPITGVLETLNSVLSNANIDAFLSQADAYINNRTQQDFYYHTGELEFRDGNGKNGIVLYHYPLLAISHVIMYNPLQSSLRTFLDNELIVDPVKGEFWIPQIYPGFLADKNFLAQFGNILVPGNRNIEILYDWGYIQPPMDITTAATYHVMINLLRAFIFLFLAGVMTSRSINGYSESFSGPQFANKLPQEEMWMKEMEDILMRRSKVYLRSIR